MSELQLSFVFTHGSVDKTANPLSVVNAHIATYGHRKRRQGGTKDTRPTRIRSQTQHAQGGHKLSSPEVTGPDTTFIHCTFPRSIDRLSSYGSTSSSASFHDHVDGHSEENSRSCNTDSGLMEQLDPQRNQDRAGFPHYSSAEHLQDGSWLLDSTTSFLGIRDPPTSSSALLSSSRIGWLDPFNDFPIKLARQDYFLLNHYKFAIPSTIFGVHKSDNYSIQKNLFFPIAMREKTWLFQLLAFASGDRDRRLGLKNESALTSRYLCAALRSINEKISDPRTCYTDEMAGAISSAAYVEHYTGRRPAFNAHIRALARIMRFRKARQVQVDPYIDAVTISHLVTYCKAFVETLIDPPNQSSPQASVESQDIQEITTEVVQSTMLMRNLVFWHAERHSPRPSCKSPDHAVAEAKLRQRLQIIFAPVSILMALLREPERINSPIALIKDSEESYRLYGICYLLLVLWDYRDDPKKCSDVCCAVETAIVDQKITTYTMSRVVWILLKDHGDDAVRRRWTTLSMVKALYIMGPRREAMVRSLYGILEDMGSA